MRGTLLFVAALLAAGVLPSNAAREGCAWTPDFQCPSGQCRPHRWFTWGTTLPFTDDGFHDSNTCNRHVVFRMDPSKAWVRKVANVFQCCALCQADPLCRYWQVYDNACRGDSQKLCMKYSWVSARPLRIKDSVAGVYAANYRGGDPAPPQGNCDMPNGQCFSGLGYCLNNNRAYCPLGSWCMGDGPDPCVRAPDCNVPENTCLSKYVFCMNGKPRVCQQGRMCVGTGPCVDEPAPGPDCSQPDLACTSNWSYCLGGKQYACDPGKRCFWSYGAPCL